MPKKIKDPIPGTIPVITSVVGPEISNVNKVYATEITVIKIEMKEISIAWVLVKSRWNGPTSKWKCLGWTVIDNIEWLTVLPSKST